MGSGNTSGDGCHSCDIIREQLNELHDRYGLSWRKIANVGQYRGIPAGTLCAIAKGTKEIPDKFKARFGILIEVPVAPCPIHGVVHKYDCQTQTINRKRKTKQKEYKSLFDWPVSKLRWALENREDMQT